MDKNISVSENNIKQTNLQKQLKEVLGKKQIIVLVVLFIIITTIVLLFYLNQKEQVPVGQSQTAPRLKYEKPDQAFNLQRLTNPEPMTKNEDQKRNKIVSQLRQIKNVTEDADVEGVVFENENVSLIYVSGPDDFEAEIRTGDFNLAKRETEKFFEDQGFSKNAICKGIRLFYYVNEDLKNALPQGTPFDPNPLSCQIIPTPIP